MDGGGIGSATGLAAPNAGQVGSAPTRDIKKKQGDRVEVTKNASWHAGALAGMEKTALSRAQKWGVGVGVGAGTASGILAIYDKLRARGLDKDQQTIQHEIVNGKLVDSKQWVKKIDPTIVVATTRQDINKALADEGFKGEVLKAITHNLSSQIERGQNAFAFMGVKKSYIMTSSRMSANVLGHEIGHVIDFRKRGLNFKNRGPYQEGVLAGLFKSKFNTAVMDKERRAWDLSPNRKKPTRVERAALNTYEKSFHKRRSETATSLSALAFSAALLSSGV
jgi:hypothetical protein